MSHLASNAGPVLAPPAAEPAPPPLMVACRGCGALTDAHRSLLDVLDRSDYTPDKPVIRAYCSLACAYTAAVALPSEADLGPLLARLQQDVFLRTHLTEAVLRACVDGETRECYRFTMVCRTQHDPGPAPEGLNRLRYVEYKGAVRPAECYVEIRVYFTVGPHPSPPLFGPGTARLFPAWCRAVGRAAARGLCRRALPAPVGERVLAYLVVPRTGARPEAEAAAGERR